MERLSRLPAAGGRTERAGLDYLFGAADRDGGYDGGWALDQPAEKHAFERFIDRVTARWLEYPGFHIYHYGAYETIASSA